LYNFYSHHELPDPSDYLQVGNGIVIEATKLTEDLIQVCQRNGFKVGVWIDTTVFTENLPLYIRVFELGVDFFITDYPLVV
jgi:glycerophosphoryl diester phosphodiesterase